MFSRMHTDDSGIPDFGVGEQELLQFGRSDLKSLVFDQFFEAVDDADQARSVICIESGADMCTGKRDDLLDVSFGINMGDIA
jgi:hypothetical protein